VTKNSITRRRKALTVAAVTLGLTATGALTAGVLNPTPALLPAAPVSVAESPRSLRPLDTGGVKTTGRPEPRTAPAAARAAARFFALLGEDGVSPARVEELLATFLTARFARRNGDGYRRGVDFIAQGLGERGGTPIFRTFPLGYRVDGFDNTRARVAIWRLQVLGTTDDEVVAGFDTVFVELIHARGRWLIDDVPTASDGPTPAPLATPAATPTPAVEAVAGISAFNPFGP